MSLAAFASFLGFVASLPSVLTFGIVSNAKERTESALNRIAKRAAKKGLPVPSWSWGATTLATETHNFRDGEIVFSKAVIVERIALVLTAAPVKYAGWTFLATVDHIAGESGERVNWVSCLPGHSVPASHKDRGPVCDHCRSNRIRNKTYIVKHDSGEIVTVGSTCVADFLGGNDAANVAAQAEMVASLRAIGLDGEGFSAGGNPDSDDLPSFLGAVAFLVRTEGWVSRWRDTGYGPERNEDATADRVRRAFADRKDKTKILASVTDEDRALVAGAIDWASDLSDGETSKSDYLEKCKQVACLGFVNHKLAGIGASIVTAYQREIGRRRLAAQRAALPSCDAYAGTVGDKVTFGLPAKTGKRGQPLKGAPTVLSADPVTLEFVTGYETSFGYTTVLKFRDSLGHTLVWKASGTDLDKDCVGKRYTLAGTIKAHTEYKGTKQTLLTRCALSEVTADVASDAA